MLKRAKRLGLWNFIARFKDQPIAAQVASNPQRDHRDPQQHHQRRQKCAKPSTHAPQHEAGSYHANRLNES
jgi:hypothetical protein